MKKIIAKIQSKIDTYVIKRFQSIAPKQLVINLYRAIAQKELLIEEREINVKKGKRRYTLLILKDKNLETVYNLGRY